MSDITVRFLGSGDAFGSGGRLQTCVHVHSEHASFLIDCGATCLTAMKRLGADPAGIDSILLTHLHGDHFGGLPFFLLEAQLVSRRATPLVIAGPPGLEERIRSAMEVLFPGSSRAPLRFPLRFLELGETASTEIGPLTVTPYAVVHPSGAPAYALRIGCGGRTIAYSGDTEWTDALIPAARGADLFICEAYTFDKKVKYHLDYRSLRGRRAEFGCRRMILTHLGEEMLRRLPDVDAEWAEDGKTVSL